MKKKKESHGVFTLQNQVPNQGTHKIQIVFFLKFLYLFIYFKEQIEHHLTLVMDSFVKSMIVRLFFNFFFLDCVEENIIWWKVINKEREREREYQY